MPAELSDAKQTEPSVTISVHGEPGRNMRVFQVFTMESSRKNRLKIRSSDVVRPLVLRDSLPVSPRYDSPLPGSLDEVT